MLSKRSRQNMLLLEVLLSLSIMGVLAAMLMGNLGYLFVRGQKEKAMLVKETQFQILDLTILRWFEELIVHLPNSGKGHLPLYIDESEGKKSLIFFIYHAQDMDERFVGGLQCRLFHDHGVLKFSQENEKYQKREIAMMNVKSIQFELFDPISKEWTKTWIKEQEYLPPVLRVVIDQEEKRETLYYLTPFLKTPIPISS